MESLDRLLIEHLTNWLNLSVNCFGPPQLLCHSLIGYCSVITSSPGQNHLPAPTGDLWEAHVCLPTSVFWSVCICMYHPPWHNRVCLFIKIILIICICNIKRWHFFINDIVLLAFGIYIKKSGCGGGGMNKREKKKRGRRTCRRRGGRGGGEGPASSISRATVHEPCWLQYYFNSSSHLPYYLLIYTHHYGDCSSMCDE